MSIENCQLKIVNCIALLGLAASTALAAPPLRSGPQPGESPLPFTSNMVTGPHRGRQYCYVCELKEEPAVLVFARSMDPPTARLLQQLREQVRAHRDRKLFGWFVFLGAEDTPSETALEHEAYAFAQRNGATSVPVSILGDPQGPPGYRVSPDAEVTVVLFQGKKVLANRSYRRKDWNVRAAENALKDLSRLIRTPPASP